MIFYEFFVNMNSIDKIKEPIFKALYFSESEQVRRPACYFIKLAVCAEKKLAVASVYAYTIGDLFEARE